MKIHVIQSAISLFAPYFFCDERKKAQNRGGFVPKNVFCRVAELGQMLSSFSTWMSRLSKRLSVRMHSEKGT